MGYPGIESGAKEEENGPPVGFREVFELDDVDPSLAGNVKPGALLFVAAREPGIPGPPIAATRITTDDLPAVVVLSDADTMIAGRDLSSVNDIEIVARVADGGTAVTASGDLIGRAVQKKGGSENLDVVINQVQP